jgi:hypothetical protein
MAQVIRFRSSHKRLAPLRVSHVGHRFAPPEAASQMQLDRDAVDEKYERGKRGKKKK